MQHSSFFGCYQNNQMINICVKRSKFILNLPQKHLTVLLFLSPRHLELFPLLAHPGPWAEWNKIDLTLYLIEMPFNTFANRTDPDQAALVRATWSGSTLFTYGNMLYQILLKWTWQVIPLFYVPTWTFIYIIIPSGWSLAWIFMRERVNTISNQYQSL